jgi:hypothetical protein
MGLEVLEAMRSQESAGLETRNVKIAGEEDEMYKVK